MTLVVGIDVGGTKIAAGVVDVEHGTIVAAERVPTAPERGSEAVLADCLALAARLSAGRAVTAVGLGLCEAVDADGRATSADTVDWRGRDVAAELGAVAPARVESDVRAAALAEARFGAGRGFRELLFVIVGTGIAHCLVLDGEPYRGARGNAIATGSPLIEELASGRALAAAAGTPGAEQVLADPAHEPLVERAAAGLGATLAALVNALDPAAVVIGGGLGLEARYRARVEAALRAGVWAPETATLPVLPAALGSEAGIVGAALSALPAP